MKLSPQPVELPPSATTPLFPKPSPPSGAAAPAAPAAPAPAGPQAPKPDAAAIVSMSAPDAVAAATKQLTTVADLTVGGGTKAGIAAGKQGAMMLKDASLLFQLVHRAALPTQISPELEVNLMGTAVDLAAASTKVDIIGLASKQPVKVGAAIPTIAQAKDLLAVVADHVNRAAAQDKNPSPAGGYL